MLYLDCMQYIKCLAVVQIHVYNSFDVTSVNITTVLSYEYKTIAVFSWRFKR